MTTKADGATETVIAATAQQRFRNGNYDQEFKKRVILTAEQTSNRVAEKQFGVSESNIRRWRKLRDEIFAEPFLDLRRRRGPYVEEKDRLSDQLEDTRNEVFEALIGGQRGSLGWWVD